MDLGRNTRYRDHTVVYAGVTGQNLVVPSADPRNHHQVISAPASMPAREIDAKLFVPPGTPANHPAVVIVPGSLGVGPNHEMHAESLVSAGFVVCVIDPFGPRQVDSTIADQTQYSFAASAFDVLATVAVLAERDEIDPDRISAQGHSRGGSAVTIASSRRFADAVLGQGRGLRAAYAVYPWCGQQFLDPTIGSTAYRAIIGDRDEWCSVQQVQAQVHAMSLGGGAASIRIVPGAAHSFDRLEPVTLLADAHVAPSAPTTMLADDGAMLDAAGRPDADLTDRDVFVAHAKSGFLRHGAHIGGVGDQPELFRQDMLDFHHTHLGTS